MSMNPVSSSAYSAAVSSARARWLSLPRLALGVSERRLLLALGDLAAVNLALLAALAIRQGTIIPRYEPTIVPWWLQALWHVVLTALWLLVASVFDVYDLPLAANQRRSLPSACAAAVVAVTIYFFVPYITPSMPVRRLEALTLPLAAVIGVAVWRTIYTLLLLRPGFYTRALVVGAGWAGATLTRAVHAGSDAVGQPPSGLGYQIIGFVDDDLTKQGMELEGARVLGNRADLVRLARELRPDELVVAITHPETIHFDLFAAILACRELGIPTTSMADVYERITGRIPVEHAGRNLYVVLPIRQPPTQRLYIASKRLLDLVVGLLGCSLLLCLIPLAWLVNRLTSPGPLFYWQERVGQGGRRFRVVTFRSMVVDAEAGTGAVWAAEADPRVTPLGRVLRRTRLDELPQCWNILRGDMTFIGPRPERPEFVEELAQEIPFYRIRHAMKPGLTGWAQVRYRYGASVEDALIKLQYDLYYIKHQNLLLDLEILAKRGR